jgi:asparagine synthase (glutamine-hydrolysing)
MCGIAGCAVAPGRKPDRAALERMVAALAHRGPDDRGVELIGPVGLAHTRLAIVDPTPAGHQPMRAPDGGWWITYNGEVFNHLELRAALPGVRWRGASDSETLVAALARWGEDAIPRCNGLYAYAALDERSRRLLLVRDRFGVKPLYWARHAGALWFASEIGALLAAGIPRRPRRDVLAHAVGTGWANGPLTPVEGVFRLLPGTLMSVDLGTLEASERCWYEPLATVDPERADALARLAPERAVLEVERALRESVRRRLMSDVPLGTMCSGGIDSSLITAFAAAETGELHCFNAALVDQPELDESEWAGRVAGELGARLHTVEVSGDSFRRDFVRAVKHIEYPLTHPSSVPMAQIARLARERGVKVLLSGEGADELFGGYPWLHLAEHGDFLARRRPLERLARPVYRALQARGRFGGAPAWPPPGPAGEVHAYEYQVTEAARGAYAHHRGARRRLEAGFASYLRLYLPHLLNRQDKSTMQWSIETRVPFLDPDLVALAVNLPLELKVEPARKELLRELARRHVPAAAANRAKVGFAVNARAYIEPAARAEALADGRLRDVLGVGRDAWAARVAALDDYAALLHWSGEVWCRLFLDGEPAESVEEALWRPPTRTAAAPPARA